jgi:hypothetical protein
LEPVSTAEDNSMLDVLEEEAWRSTVDTPELDPTITR